MVKELFTKQQKSVTTEVFEGSQGQLNKWYDIIRSYNIFVLLLIRESKIYKIIFSRGISKRIKLMIISKLVINK